MQQHKSTKPFGDLKSGRGYRNRRYRGVFQRLVAWREQRLARHLLAYPYSGCNGHIVDIPCGYGRFYPLLRTMGLRVTAMDQSQAMVELYRTSNSFRPEEDDAQRADILQPLPADASTAGRAFCIRLFQHLHDTELRRQALQTLAGNGRRIVMTYYDKGCLHYWSKRALMWLKGKPVRVKMIAHAEFESEVAAAGLRVIKRIKLLPGLHAQTWVLLEPQ